MMLPRFSALLLLLSLGSLGRAELTLVSGVSIPGGGEVVAHAHSVSGRDVVLVTNSLARTGSSSHKVDLYHLGQSGALTFAASVELDGVFGAAATLSVSSVAADPSGRGFGVATIIPADNTRVLGKLAFFELTTGSLLRTVDVGFHPDAVRFTPDGRRAIVANEGEFSANQAQAPGSVSVVNLSGITTATSLLVNAPSVVTVDFKTGLAPGVTLDAVRINVANVAAADRYLYIEPEFPAVTNDKAYITLQENNAIATLDLSGLNANTFTAISPLGTISQRIDASDRDPQNGGVAGINIDDVLPGLPMPDTIISFVQGGRRLLATANEGDARTDDGDIARAGDANVVDTVQDGAGDLIFSGSLNASSGIGRLNISRFDGNTDADALIEVPTMLGTRSFTLWDTAGNRVFDSGSMLEEFVRTNAPLTFNMNNGATSNIDTRSDDKGPEPEALAYGEINGRQYLFVGAERQNGIFQFDVTNLNRVEIVGYFNIVDGTKVTTGTQYVSPETLAFIPAAENPTGRPLLLVGYEGVEGSIAGSVAVLEVTPSSARLSNGSIRSTVQANQTTIVGFGSSGDGSVLMRAVGPGLAAYGVTGALDDPRLALFTGAVQIDTNDDWMGSPAIASATLAVGAFPLANGSRDAVLLRSLSGASTLHLAARSTGAALIEFYGVGPDVRFENFSARGRVGTNEGPLIGGFVVVGSGTRTILVRAVGPRLTAFGVSDVLADPRLEVYRGNFRVGANDDWAQATTASDFTAAGAFLLDGDYKPAALRLTVTPGEAYTVHASGISGASGEVLLEVYEIK
ncbi:MAG: choice-of-anchor I family protein [Opitutaceae bacterium]|nr:choice-of-anchor I family protein [Opitutaceae bacterium]